jgi:hypothetical protein
MISKQGQELALLVSRPSPVREDSESTLVEVSRPRKRVRISMEEPILHTYQKESASFSSLSSSREDSSPSMKEEFRLLGQYKSEDRLPTNKPKSDHTINPWLTRKELAYFRSCAKKLSKSVDLDPVLKEVFNENNSNDDTVLQTNRLLKCTDFLEHRGLERWSGMHHSFLRSLKIVEVKSAVLLEQSTQILSGRSDPDKLSVVSREASQVSQRFAEVLARADAELAMEVHSSGHDQFLHSADFMEL